MYEANLAALEQRSPGAARIVSLLQPDPGLQVSHSATGEPVLERDGRVLDSRRDPMGTAKRQAEAVTENQVVLAGFGMGYLAEALLERGIDVRAIVDAGGETLAAAMRSRDLRIVLGRVPVHLITDRPNAVELACLRRQARAIVPHAPSVSMSASLRAVVENWNAIRVANRPPRVLVVGPIYGGSVEIARYAASGMRASGADTRLFDATVYGDAYSSLESLDITRLAKATLQGELADVAGRAVMATVAVWQPDLVFALAQAPLGPAILDNFRQAGVTTAFWWVENNRVLPYWQIAASRYDWFYAIQPGPFLERLAEAGAEHPRYLPLACDPVRHKPMALTPADRVRFEADVSFAGSPYLNRRHIFTALADLRIRLWGRGWSDPALAGLVAEGGKTFTADEMVKVFAGTKINLNVHSAEHVYGLDPEPDYVNPRTFELAACRAFQLVDRRTPLPDLFTEDEIVTFSSVPELRSLVEHYRGDEEGRRACASAAQARALRHHTYAHRMEQVLRDTLPPDLTAAALAGVKAETLDEAIDKAGGGPLMDRDEALLLAVREVQRTWMEKR
jgi:spore maturation protein CgeB